ncbi:MAG: glycerate kinase [Clostridiales bacterium]|nr:glycerate kinase [Clostridiales bacterium]
MKKVVIVPDSFKGTLQSAEVCEIISERVKAHFPRCEILSFPVADGGEGSTDCFLSALGGEKIYLTVKNPYMEDMTAYYGLINDGTAAVIEMASAAGLPLVEGRKDPLKTTTFGVGQMILDAAKRGCREIIIGLGGSCTNDCGAGAAAALGVRFINADGKEFVPTGGTLSSVARIDMSGMAKELKNIKIVSMCDIENPLYGEKGAAYVFAPQKGADENAVKYLDDGLRSFSDVIKRDVGKDVSKIAGGGAAGGMGAGMSAFFDSELKSGISAVLDTIGFDEKIKGADVIFTGEGKLDAQSMGGKVVIGVSRRAEKQNVPVIAVVGGADENISAVYGEGVTCVFTINRLPEPLEKSRFKSKENLRETVDNILRLIKIKNT